MRRSAALAGVVLSVAVAVVVAASMFGSSEPDGLERVAADEGFAAAADVHALADQPLADYGGDDTGSTIAAGLVGIALTLALGCGVMWFARSRAGRGDTAGAPSR